MKKKAVLMYDNFLSIGGYPDNCPFDSSRAVKTFKTIISLGLMGYSHCTQIAPLPTSRKEMLLFHTSDYLDTIIKSGEGYHNFNALKKGLGTPDNPIFADMYNYLAMACGGTTTGAQLILKKEANIIFNPSGGFHHAKPNEASGFCYINDVVLGCLLLVRARKKVLLLDFDVHHGDGTQEAFYDCNDVFTISMHESGKTLFPGTGYANEIGRNKGLGYNVNIPLPVGTEDIAYYKAFKEVVLPLARAIDYDIIVLELGMDALSSDPLAHLNLTNNCYADIISDIVELNKPILAVGGGGYHVENTVRGWTLAWNILCNGRDDDAREMGLGLGGVMLENTAWFGGLRDKTLLSHGGFRQGTQKEIDDTVQEIKSLVFPIHNIE